jgi:hypothetical protein
MALMDLKHLALARATREANSVGLTGIVNVS